MKEAGGINACANLSAEAIDGSSSNASEQGNLSFRSPSRIVTSYLVVPTVLRCCNLGRHSPDNRRQRQLGPPYYKSPDERG